MKTYENIPYDAIGQVLDIGDSIYYVKQNIIFNERRRPGFFSGVVCGFKDDKYGVKVCIRKQMIDGTWCQRLSYVKSYNLLLKTKAPGCELRSAFYDKK